MTPRATILTHARQLLTLRGAARRRGASMNGLGIIPDGAVLIEEGTITAVGTTDELRQQSKNTDEIDCRYKVVLPRLRRLSHAPCLHQPAPH